MPPHRGVRQKPQVPNLAELRLVDVAELRALRLFLFLFRLLFHFHFLFLFLSRFRLRFLFLFRFRLLNLLRQLHKLRGNLNPQSRCLQ